MTYRLTYSDELSTRELERQHGEQLPARHLMALLNVNAILAANAAAAVNAGSIDSAAFATAVQTILVNQS